MLFLFKKKDTYDKNSNLAGKIKNDLARVFEKKGIDISQISIDVKSNTLNVQVYVGNK